MIHNNLSMKERVTCSGITNQSAISCNSTFCRFDYPCTSSSSCGSIRIDLPPGQYRVKLCGAQGGDMKMDWNGHGGMGGCSEGVLTLVSSQKLNFRIGGRGTSILGNVCQEAVLGGSNGGGNSFAGSGAGGGSTDIRLEDSNTPQGLRSRIMVAGGGGGANDNSDGGDGGGVNGQDGVYFYLNDFDSKSPIPPQKGTGATQTSPGLLFYPGDFGRGGSDDSWEGGGGGGGYYGGGRAHGFSSSGGGGSGFISGDKKCVAVQNDEKNTPATNSVHFSGLKFTKTKMTTGDNSGPGYAEIKVLYFGTPKMNLLDRKKKKSLLTLGLVIIN